MFERLPWCRIRPVVPRSVYVSQVLPLSGLPIIVSRRVTQNQTQGQPRSGQQYGDQLEEILDKLWEAHCKEKTRVVDVVDVAGEEHGQAGGGHTSAQSPPQFQTRQNQSRPKVSKQGGLVE